MVPLNINTSDPLAKFLLPVPATFSSAGLEVLFAERGVLLPGGLKNTPLNWTLRLPTGHFGLLMPFSYQAKSGVTVLAGVIQTIRVKLDCSSTVEVRENAYEMLGIL